MLIVNVWVGQPAAISFQRGFHSSIHFFKVGDSNWHTDQQSHSTQKLHSGYELKTILKCMRVPFLDFFSLRFFSIGNSLVVLFSLMSFPLPLQPFTPWYFLLAIPIRVFITFLTFSKGDSYIQLSRVIFHSRLLIKSHVLIQELFAP